MTGEQATAIRDVLTGAIEREAAGTRKVITNITNRDYKPDPKSRSAWELATHLVGPLVAKVSDGSLRPARSAFSTPFRIAAWNSLSVFTLPFLA